MKSKLLLIISLAVININVNAQNRANRPIQIQLSGSGAFFKIFGNALADSEVENLEVKNWGIPGIDIGYHINQRFYLGYSFEPNRNFILHEQWTFDDDFENKDLNIIVDHNTGTSHSLEGRYFPFKFDLYCSFFLIHNSKANYNMDASRINNTLTMGQNEYATDINSEWNFRSLNTVGIGLGYNYVHKSGLSFDLGIGIPIPFTKPFHENITIQSIQGVSISDEDLQSGVSQIENELFYFPMQLHINLGYNFNRKSKE